MIIPIMFPFRWMSNEYKALLFLFVFAILISSLFISFMDGLSTISVYSYENQKAFESRYVIKCDYKLIQKYKSHPVHPSKLVRSAPPLGWSWNIGCRFGKWLESE